MKTAQGHNHAEAFCLMRYESQDGRLVEWLYNGQDGVTPFCIDSRDGQVELYGKMSHYEYRPHHIPQKGDRVFKPMTQESAMAYAQMRVAAWPDHFDQEYPTQGEKDQALKRIAESILKDPCPDIITVE